MGKARTRLIYIGLVTTRIDCWLLCFCRILFSGFFFENSMCFNNVWYLSQSLFIIIFVHFYCNSISWIIMFLFLIWPFDVYVLQNFKWTLRNFPCLDEYIEIFFVSINLHSLVNAWKLNNWFLFIINDCTIILFRYLFNIINITKQYLR